MSFGKMDIMDDNPYKSLEAERSLLAPRDFMVFCQVLLNKGPWNGVRLLREDTVEMMMTYFPGLRFKGQQGLAEAQRLAA